MNPRSAYSINPLLAALVVAGGCFVLFTQQTDRHPIDQAAIEATLERFRELAAAADRHERTFGEWPDSQSHGATPLGGRFAWQRTDTLAAVTIEDATPDKLTAWHAIDQAIDDGDLSGGWVFWRDHRLFWVLEEE